MGIFIRNDSCDNIKEVADMRHEYSFNQSANFNALRYPKFVEKDPKGIPKSSKDHPNSSEVLMWFVFESRS